MSGMNKMQVDRNQKALHELAAKPGNSEYIVFHAVEFLSSRGVDIVMIILEKCCDQSAKARRLNGSGQCFNISTPSVLGLACDYAHTALRSLQTYAPTAKRGIPDGRLSIWASFCGEYLWLTLRRAGKRERCTPILSMCPANPGS